VNKEVQWKSIKRKTGLWFIEILQNIWVTLYFDDILYLVNLEDSYM